MLSPAAALCQRAPHPSAGCPTAVRQHGPRLQRRHRSHRDPRHAWLCCEASLALGTVPLLFGGYSRSWGMGLPEPRVEISCVPKRPRLACPCNDKAAVPRQTFLGTAGQQMSSVGLFSSAEHRLGQRNAPLAMCCWLSTPSAAPFCQPRATLQTAHRALLSCPALEADFIMGHQSNYLATGTDFILF